MGEKAEKGNSLAPSSSMEPRTLVKLSNAIEQEENPVIYAHPSNKTLNSNISSESKDANNIMIGDNQTLDPDIFCLQPNNQNNNNFYVVEDIEVELNSSRENNRNDYENENNNNNNNNNMTGDIKDVECTTKLFTQPKLQRANTITTKCCWCFTRHKNRKTLDVKKMKSRNNWLWFLHRVFLARCAIKALTPKNKINYSQIDPQDNLDAEQEAHCVIMPDSRFYWLWMLLIMVLLIWTALYIPYRLAFIDNANLGVFLMECFMDAIFLFDVGLNFFIAYYDSNNVVITDKKQIAIKYLKTWFTIDLVSSLPIQLLDSSMKMNKAMRLLRLPRIYRMLKVIKLMKMFNFMKPNEMFEKLMFMIKMHTGLTRLGKVLVLMAYFTHFYACLWYFVAKYENFRPDCWIMTHGLMDSSNTVKYLTAFYWVLQTTTTVGYGDMNISNNTERIFAILLMIFGVGFYSYTIGNLSSIFSTMDSKQLKLNTKIMALNELASNLKMPAMLYFKVMRILKRNATARYFNFMDQGTLLDELPAALKNEVLGLTHRQILDSFSFFKGKPPQFVMDIIPEFKHMSLATDEVVYRKGDWFEDIYFLLKGRVGFVTNDGTLFRNYVTGSYFGEDRRIHSVITMEETELLGIKRADFDRILMSYPDIQNQLRNTSLQRYHKFKNLVSVAKMGGIKINEDQYSSTYLQNRMKQMEGHGANNLYEDFYNEMQSFNFTDITSESGTRKQGQSPGLKQLMETSKDSISDEVITINSDRKSEYIVNTCPENITNESVEIEHLMPNILTTEIAYKDSIESKACKTDPKMGIKRSNISLLSVSKKNKERDSIRRKYVFMGNKQRKLSLLSKPAGDKGRKESWETHSSMKKITEESKEEKGVYLIDIKKAPTPRANSKNCSQNIFRKQSISNKSKELLSAYEQQNNEIRRSSQLGLRTSPPHKVLRTQKSMNPCNNLLQVEGFPDLAQDRALRVAPNIPYVGANQKLLKMPTYVSNVSLGAGGLGPQEEAITAIEANLELIKTGNINILKKLNILALRFVKKDTGKANRGLQW